MLEIPRCPAEFRGTRVGTRNGVAEAGQAAATIAAAPSAIYTGACYYTKCYKFASAAPLPFSRLN